MEQKIYHTLKSMIYSDYKVVDDEPNIISWKVKSSNDQTIGQVTDLLFDPSTNAVRYIIIDLQESNLDKQVMIPIGIAHLPSENDEVILPTITPDQLNELPAYDKTAQTPATEVQIRHVFEPAQSRNEKIEAFDQSTFYNHHHFDRGRFQQRIPSSQISPESSPESLPHLYPANQEIEENEAQMIVAFYTKITTLYADKLESHQRIEDLIILNVKAEVSMEILLDRFKEDYLDYVNFKQMVRVEFRQLGLTDNFQINGGTKSDDQRSYL